MWRLCSACWIGLFLILVNVPLAAQEWIKVSPENAANHLVKKVEPAYPAFAKAAGVQGAVTIRVGIGTTGRIGALMEMTGPPSLREAAQNAVLQYEYKPFDKDGQAVAADTTITVVSKLEGNVSPPPPPPDISASFKRFERAVRSDRGRYAGFKCTDCVVAISPELRKWLAADLKKQIDHLQDGSESSPEFLSLEAELQNTEVPLPVAIELIEVPIQKPGTHLYLFRPYITNSALCGATGNCSIELIEAGPGGIHATDSFGGGYSIHPHKDSPYPDIFIYSHISAGSTGVAGYSNSDGFWGQLYCGEITQGGADVKEEKDDVHVCR